MKAMPKTIETTSGASRLVLVTNYAGMLGARTEYDGVPFILVPSKGEATNEQRWSRLADEMAGKSHYADRLQHVARALSAHADRREAVRRVQRPVTCGFSPLAGV